MFNIKKYEGLVAAPFTPMDDKGNLNQGQIPRYYKFLELNGVAGAFINGSTGEGVSLTQKERQSQVYEWAGCLKAGGSVRVINLLGGTSYEECIENAILSQEAGLSAVALLGPYYFKPVDADQLAEFVTRIGEKVPTMPLYYYHIPVLTGVNISMSVFLRKISGMLPSFAGIKFTHEDFMDFFTCMNYMDGKYDLLWGRDECMLSALVLGCRGFVGSTYNYAAPLYNAMIKAFIEGNLTEARRLQMKSIEMISLLGKYGGMGTGKAYMKHIGLDCGKFRSPVKNMTDEMFNEFTRDVKKLGIDDYFSKI